MVLFQLVGSKFFVTLQLVVFGEWEPLKQNQIPLFHFKYFSSANMHAEHIFVFEYVIFNKGWIILVCLCV